MAPTRDRDRTELRFGRAELEHVPAHDRREVDRLREPAERHFEVLLRGLRRVDLAGTTCHRRALGRPRDREHVEHVLAPACGRSPSRRGRGRSRPSSSRHPTVTTTSRAPVPKCSRNAATSKSANAPEYVRPSMSSGLETGILDGPRGSLGADVSRGAARCLRVRRLADADDRHFAVDVVERCRVSPIRCCHHGARLTSAGCRPRWTPSPLPKPSQATST